MKWIFVVIVGLYAGYSIFRITSHTAPDFSVYYGVAKNALSGKGIYGDPHLFTGYGYPPYSVLPYLPLAFLSYNVSQSIWVIGSFIALIASVFLSFRLYWPKASFQTKATACALAFLAFPTRFTLGMGQSNIIVLFVLLSSLVHRSGTLLGLAWILKPQLMIIALFLAWKKQWRMLAIAIATVGFAIILAGLLFGWHWYGQYFTRELPILMVFRDREIYYNQGIEAFVSRLGADWLSTPLKLVAVVFAFLSLRKQTIIRALPMVLSLLLLILPLSWQHHFVLLIPAFVLLWYQAKGKRLLLVLALLLVGSNFKEPTPFVLSHVFIGNVLVFWMLSRVHLSRR